MMPEPLATEPEQTSDAPPVETQPRAATWSAETRRWILIGLVVVAAWLVYQLGEIIPPLVLALLLAYLLNPLVNALQKRMRWNRLAAVAIVYLALLALVLGGVVELVPIFYRQLRATILDFDGILARLSVFLRQVPLLEAIGIHADSNYLATQLRAELAALGSAAPRMLVGAASGAFSAVLVLVLSFYLLIEAEAIDRNLENAIPADYRDDWRRIKTELGSIWSSFLRGQILLSLIIGVITTIALLVLGVPNALLLGLLAGLLEAIPNLGPIVAMIPAVLIAFFQGSTRWAIEPTTFALVVIGAYVLIQQLENHLIVPNVLGSSVNLPPVVILIGAFAGASLAGVLGIFLAAPVLATARLFGRFLLRKLLEPLPRE